MKTKQALREYLLEVEIRKFTPKTIRSYRNNLNLFIRYLEEEAEVHDTEDITLTALCKYSINSIPPYKPRADLSIVFNLRFLL